MSRALNAVSGSASMVSRLLDLIDGTVVVTDLDGLVIGWSYGAELVLEYRSQDVLGSTIVEIYGEEERAAYCARCRELLQEASRSDFDAKIRTRSGVLFDARVSLTLVRDASGGPDAFVNVIAPRRETTAGNDAALCRVRELGSLLDSIPMLFAHLDSSRRYLYMNKTGMRMVGTDRVVGRHVRDVLGETAYEKLLPYIDDVLSGSESIAEFPLVNRDGSVKHLFAHRMPERGMDGAVTGYFVISLDITQARVYQEERLHEERQLRDTLVREVHHRIKNSLQGVIGMMRLHTIRDPHAAGVIDHAVSQLMAIAAVFGLASRRGTSQILLCDLVSQIARDVEQQLHRRIDVTLSPPIAHRGVALREAIGPNTSLIINELIFNAVKHSSWCQGGNCVKVYVDRDDSGAAVRVINERGSLPRGFDLESGIGLGTGLGLIKALVAPEECELRITQENGAVLAELKLKPSVLALTDAESRRPSYSDCSTLQ
jgi:PAS domain S-box-containing protein